MTIKFVYFDLGNVLVHFDPNIAVRQVANVLDVEPASIQSAMYDSGIEVQLESGQISESEFLDGLFDRVGKSADPKEVLQAMSAMFWLNHSMLPVVCKLLTQQMPMAILSNTCHPHWDWIQRKNYGLVRAISSNPILSYEVGSMKPDRTIYDAATEKVDCSPDEIFFIDDRIENVQGAVASGWKAAQFTGIPRLLSDLRALGLSCFI